MEDSTPNVEEFEYFKNKHTDRTYISKSFKSFDYLDLDKPKNLRIISKVLDSEESYEFAKVKQELVLRVTPSRRQEIKIMFYEDSRDIKCITIQRFTVKNYKPHQQSFTFRGKEIEVFFNLLKLIRYIELKDSEKVRIDDKVIDEWLLSDNEKMKFFLENTDLVKEISEHHITKSDIIAYAYRKNQLEVFEKLLNNQGYFESKKEEWGLRGDEAVWQHFFERNSWIFGYGLNYIFTSQLDFKKLEQITSGHSVNSSGKRVDALMKTRGLISSLCFVEIKTHKTPLLKNNSYRSECWPVSEELSGSIAQLQKTVQKAINDIETKLEIDDSSGYPTGELAFLYLPRAFIIIGCLEEFIGNQGVNEQKYSSFELFRRNLTNPEIITYDELFERAKYIIELSEHENNVLHNRTYQDKSDFEIPF